MKFPGLDLALSPLAAPLPVAHASVDAAQWMAAAESAVASGARLVSLWGIDRRGDAGELHRVGLLGDGP